jgi:hypothetical protein
VQELTGDHDAVSARPADPILWGDVSDASEPVNTAHQLRPLRRGGNTPLRRPAGFRCAPDDAVVDLPVLPEDESGRFSQPDRVGNQAGGRLHASGCSYDSGEFVRGPIPTEGETASDDANTSGPPGPDDGRRSASRLQVKGFLRLG